MRYTAIGLAALLMVGCGDGDGGGAPPGPVSADFLLEIEGKVVASGVGASIAGARVVIKARNGRSLSATTDADGNFAVRARLPDRACELPFVVPCTVEVVAGGYRPKSFQHDFSCPPYELREPQRLDIALEPQ